MTKFIEIDTIEELEETSDVYDMEVENVHNFFADGLLVHNCLAGLGSWLTLREHENGPEAVQRALDEELLPLFDIFGKDNAFAEIQFNKLPEQKIVNDALIKWSQRNNYKLLATVDSHYAKPEWWRDREIYRLLSQQTRGFRVEKDSLPKTIDELKCELYPKNGDQLFQEYKSMYGEDSSNDQLVKEAIERSHEIAEQHIEYVYPESNLRLPKISVNEFDTLKALCIQELKKKNLHNDNVYVDRLAKELKVIRDKNFSSYFLVLSKAMTAIKEKMLVGPARGSGAGSLVNYLLGITLIDPLKHDLLFERFLASYRDEFPDIDTDIEDRDVATEILRKEFGADNVLNVSNFNTMQLKTIIKDVCKFYDIQFSEVNEVTTKMEAEARPHILADVGGDQKLYSFELEGAKKYSPTFQKFLEKYPKIADHIEILFKQIKTISTHAGGIVICDDSNSCMPIMRVRGMDQTPWTEGMAARHLENFGLIKYDFLGLATLRYIRRCIELILQKQNIQPTFSNVMDFYNKNLHPDNIVVDSSVMENVYHKGNFPAIFQFTENGARNFAKRAQPDDIEEISVLTSIFRPGPLHGQVDKQYVEIKQGHKDPQLEHPVLQEVLGKTKGLIVYQEQFMLLAHKLAGFSLEESDKLRKLLVKPISSMSDDMKSKRIEYGEKFINGCIASGISPDRAHKLWHDEILGFISYGFNKSHAIAYSYNSYHCAWLFTHHPDEWMRAFLELDSDRDKAIQDAISAGYRISKPDILKSDHSWTCDENKVLYPSLSSIKGIGAAAIEELVELRKFKNNIQDLFFDDDVKVYKSGKTKDIKVWRFSKFNRRCLESLIKCEAFESLGCVGHDRLFKNYKHMHNVIIGNYDKIKKGQLSIEHFAAETEDVGDWSHDEKIEFQEELMGTYDKELILTEGALDLLRDNGILPLSDVNEQPKNHWFILKSHSHQTTKTGKPYVKLEITDLFETTKKLNYFGDFERGFFKKNCLYISPLYLKGEWLNVPFGHKMHKMK